MISSLDFGSNIFNYSLFSFCLHFAYSFLIKLAKYINLLTHYAKGTPTLWLTVFHFRFQNLFHFLLGILFSIFFTVLVRYRSILLYLSLEGGPPLFEQFCYRLTQFFIYIIFFFKIRIFTCLFFSVFFQIIYHLGLFHVRSPLLTESWLFSFPFATEMSHFAKLFF